MPWPSRQSAAAGPGARAGPPASTAGPRSRSCTRPSPRGLTPVTGFPDYRPETSCPHTARETGNAGRNAHPEACMKLCTKVRADVSHVSEGVHIVADDHEFGVDADGLLHIEASVRSAAVPGG